MNSPPGNPVGTAARQGRRTLVLTSPPGLGRTALAAADRGRLPRDGARAVRRRRPRRGTAALQRAARPALLRPRPAARRRPPTSCAPASRPGGLLDLLRGLGARTARCWSASTTPTPGTPTHGRRSASLARRLERGRRVAVVITEAQRPDGTMFRGLPAPPPRPARRPTRPPPSSTGSDGRATDPVVRGRTRARGGREPAAARRHSSAASPADQLAGRTALPCPLPGAESVLDAHAAQLDGLSPRTPAPSCCWPPPRRSTNPTGRARTPPCCCGPGRCRAVPPASDRVLSRPRGAPGPPTGRQHGCTSAIRCCAARSCAGPRRPAAGPYTLLLATLLNGPADPAARLVQRACAADPPDPALAGGSWQRRPPPPGRTPSESCRSGPAARSPRRGPCAATGFGRRGGQAWLAGDTRPGPRPAGPRGRPPAPGRAPTYAGCSPCATGL